MSVVRRSVSRPVLFAFTLMSKQAGFWLDVLAAFTGNNAYSRDGISAEDLYDLELDAFRRLSVSNLRLVVFLAFIVFGDGCGYHDSGDQDGFRFHLVFDVSVEISSKTERQEDAKSGFLDPVHHACWNVGQSTFADAQVQSGCQECAYEGRRGDERDERRESQDWCEDSAWEVREQIKYQSRVRC